MKRWILGVVTAIAFSFVGASTASAQGYGGYGCGPSYGGYSSGYGGYGYYPRWHDTSHFDYHPGYVRPHRGHYHYVPSHYDYHRSGHSHW